MSNREIKFRAWDGEKMHHGEDSLESIVHAQKLEKMGAVELMQYTGLKDKKSKEIYEGDVLVSGVWNETKYPSYNKNLVVIFHQFKFALKCGQLPNGVDLISDFDEHFKSTEELEVIGNIYENPELLD